jgi:hypothetical protein
MAQSSNRGLQCATYRDGELIYLPEPRDAKSWGISPDAWRPVAGHVWPDALPVPLNTPSPQMWSARSSFALVDDAEAADLAREMEHDRISGAIRRSERARDKLQWWKDASLIAHHPPGQITARHAEGRVMRAVAVSDADKGARMERSVVGRALADLSAAADQAYAQVDPTHDYAIRFQPLPADHDDFDEAMRWFTALNPPATWHHRRKPWSLNREQRVLFYRARLVPLSYDDIGARVGGISGERARQINVGALAKIHAIANAPSTVLPELTAIRKRNRAYHLGTS